MCFPGRQYDKDGVLRQWWTSDVIRRFRVKALCFVQQYSKYKTSIGLRVGISSFH